jgi:glycosyltransferase involved in cell wall biosynthesis
MDDLARSGGARIGVSVMIFTLDEELHLPSCLAALAWCDYVIVIDSFSSDRTQSICEQAGVRFFQNRFTGFGDQRNWALLNSQPRHPWILILDADERVTPELVEEFKTRLPAVPADIGAFRLRRRFHMWGRWLRYSSLYPTWVVRLVHRDRVSYINRGHAETQQVQGRVADLDHDLIDENLKGIDEWFERQNRYSSKDAEFELAQEGQALSWSALFSPEPLARRALLKQVASRLPFRPALYFFYSYVLRLGFLDGRDGLVFCQMKATYQRMVAVKKHDMKRGRKP